MAKPTKTNAQLNKCEKYTYATDFYMQMTYDCTVTSPTVTICIYLVIPSTKQTEIQKGHNTCYTDVQRN